MSNSHAASHNLENQSKRHELLVTSLFRVFKLATMHKLDNQAVLRGVEHATQNLREIFVFEDEAMEVLFVEEDIFINGQALKASRDTYESLRELGELLSQLSYNQIQLKRKIDASDLFELLRRFEDLRTTRSLPPERLHINRRILLQGIDLSALRLEEDGKEELLSTRIARAIATTRVLLDYTVEAGIKGSFPYTSLLKRSAQQLVMLSQEHAGHLIQSLETRSGKHDTRNLCVQTALLSTLMMHALTREPRDLMDITLCALYLALPRAHFARALRADDPFGDDGLATELGEHELSALPLHAALLATHRTGFYDRSLRRATLAMEVFALLSPSARAPLYQGKIPPSLEAILLSTTWRFFELLAIDELAHEAHHATMDEVVSTLIQEAQTPAARLVLKLLCATLGLFPRGTCVWLDSGVEAVVSANHDRADLLGTPQVYLKRSTHHAPEFVDLASPSPQVLALGHIEGLVATRSESLAALQQEILQRRVIPPALSTPDLTPEEQLDHLSSLDARGSEPLEEPSDAVTHVLSLTDAERHRVRLAPTQNASAEQADEDLILSPDPHFFSTHND